MKKSIAVIGQGFVGGSLATVFSERNFTVYAHDKVGKMAPGSCLPSFGKPSCRDSYRRHRQLSQFVEACEIFDGELRKRFTGIYFLCLPTPMNETGACDLGIVVSVLEELNDLPGRRDRIAVIKSTVPPGSVARWNEKFDNLSVVFSPEFLTEANALDDMRNQDRIILGGPRPHINRVRDVFRRAFPGVSIIKTGSTTAEMVKYVTNIHLAVKVALANEFQQICVELDKNGGNIDYDKVIEYATLDDRLGKTHWQVPGPMPDDSTGEPAYGFGGSCVTPNTLVKTSLGVRAVSDVYDSFCCGESIEVDSSCAQVTYPETKNVRNMTRRKYTGFIVRISVGGEEIETTPEHLFPVRRNGNVMIVHARHLLHSDLLFVCEESEVESENMKFVAKEIDGMSTEPYDGDVYNFELDTNDSSANDDLFWIANNIVTHNCFVKDINALIHQAKMLGVDPKVMMGAWTKNLEVRPQRDWEKLRGRAVSEEKS